MAEQIVLNIEVKGLVELYFDIKERSNKAFKAQQVTKNEFVKNYNEMDFGGYYRFQLDMKELEKLRNDFEKQLDFIEQFCRMKYNLDIFEELVVNQKKPVYSV